VVDDPVPGGFEPLNTDLATTSMVDADKGKFQAGGGSLWFKYGDWSEYGFSFWNFYHKELLHHAARFYADYLPPGNYHLSYMAQAIGAGDYAILPARAEEMYDPNVYGKTSSEQLKVETNLPADK
jgi:alpha-2-macroglobulin